MLRCCVAADDLAGSGTTPNLLTHCPHCALGAALLTAGVPQQTAPGQGGGGYRGGAGSSSTAATATAAAAAAAAGQPVGAAAAAGGAAGRAASRAAAAAAAADVHLVLGAGAPGAAQELLAHSWSAGGRLCQCVRCVRAMCKAGASIQPPRSARGMAVGWAQLLWLACPGPGMWILAPQGASL